MAGDCRPGSMSSFQEGWGGSFHVHIFLFVLIVILTISPGASTIFLSTCLQSPSPSSSHPVFAWLRSSSLYSTSFAPLLISPPFFSPSLKPSSRFKKGCSGSRPQPLMWNGATTTMANRMCTGYNRSSARVARRPARPERGRGPAEGVLPWVKGVGPVVSGDKLKQSSWWMKDRRRGKAF